MSRNRKSARDAGRRFSTETARYLAANYDDRIETREKNGAKDRGDISGVRLVNNARVVLECKNHGTLDLAGWYRQAETERINDGAVATAVVHNRRGIGNYADQWVTMTLRDFIALLTGARPGEDQ